MAFRHYSILALLLIANLALAGYLIKNYHAGKATASRGSTEQPNRLPLLELQNDAGQTVSTKNFAGSTLFVQFVNPYVDEHIKSVARVYENRPKRAVSWLLITKDARRLRAQLPTGLGDAVVVEEGYDVLRKAFNVPDCCEKWLIYDSSGEFKESGYYNQDDTSALLRRFADGKEALSPRLLAEAIGSVQGGLIVQVRARTMRSASKRAVIVMFSSACSACPTGQLITLLNKHAKLNKEIEYLALLPDTFTPVDVNNFRVNMDISFAVGIADKELSRRWLSLIHQYGEKAVNGAVIVLDRGELSAVHGLYETNQRLVALASK